MIPFVAFDLIIWQKAYKLVLKIYRIIKTFPKSEIYGLTQQIRRAAIFIPSSIAEGNGRKHKAEYQQFLFAAHASLLELEIQYLLSLDLN